MALKPVVLPPGGTPGKFDPRNPTLLPNFSRQVALGSTISAQSPAGALAAEPRADATMTATIGGSVTTGDEITLEVSNGTLPGGFLSHTYTTVGGDTVSTIAEALAFLFNQDPVAAAANITMTAAAGVITVNHNGPIGNLSVVSSPLSEPSKITIAGTALTGDEVNVVFTDPNAVLTPATATALFSGVYVPGDTVALTFTNAGVSGLPVTKTYTVATGDTNMSTAAGLVALIEGDATLNAAGISAAIVGDNDDIIMFSQQGAIGNSTVISSAVSGAEVISFDPSNGQMSGGSGQAGGIRVFVDVTTGNTATQIAAALVTAIGASAELVALGITATNTAGVVNLVVPAADEPIGIASWVNTKTPTATITGSVAAGDVLNLTFTAAYLPGGTHTVSHTALLAETTTTLATNLAAAINADPVMEAAGISATSAANVITFAYPVIAGQIRFSESVSPGSETITLSATPTTTAVTTTNATETVTLNPSSGKMSGGTGPIFATNNFEFAPAQGGTSSFFYGQPYDLGFDVLTQMVAQGMPIT